LPTVLADGISGVQIEGFRVWSRPQHVVLSCDPRRCSTLCRTTDGLLDELDGRHGSTYFRKILSRNTVILSQQDLL
jgi:hypothetical protein